MSEDEKTIGYTRSEIQDLKLRGVFLGAVMGLTLGLLAWQMNDMAVDRLQNQNERTPTSDISTRQPHLPKR